MILIVAAAPSLDGADRRLAAAEGGEAEDTAGEAAAGTCPTPNSPIVPPQNMLFFCCLLLIIHRPKSVSQIRQGLARGTLSGKTLTGCYITYVHAVGLIRLI